MTRLSAGNAAFPLQPRRRRQTAREDGAGGRGLTGTRDPGLGIYPADSEQMLHAAKDGKEAATSNDGYTDVTIPLPSPHPFGLSLTQQDWPKATVSKKQRQTTHSPQLRAPMQLWEQDK